jgi:uncharacterized protein (TIGR02145 family)
MPAITPTSKFITLSVILICGYFNSLCQQFESFKDARDGRSYKTVKIGSQEWMAENLNANRFLNGDTILNAKNKEEWKKAGEKKQPAWCYYEFNTANEKKFGKLYNWYAVSDPRGLAPTEWHIPSRSEFGELSSHLGGDNVAGAKMKNKSGWGTNERLFIKDSSRSNSSGFCGLPGGRVFFNLIGDNKYRIDFSSVGYEGYWWTSSEVKDGAVTYFLVFTHSITGELYNFLGNGYSVRCIKNSEFL